MKRISPKFIFASYVITRSYCGVIVFCEDSDSEGYSWEVEDRLTGHAVEVSQDIYPSPAPARRALFQFAQRLQDRRDAKRERGGER